MDGYVLREKLRERFDLGKTRMSQLETLRIVNGLWKVLVVPLPPVPPTLAITKVTFRLSSSSNTGPDGATYLNKFKRSINRNGSNNDTCHQIVTNQCQYEKEVDL